MLEDGVVQGVHDVALDKHDVRLRSLGDLQPGGREVRDDCLGQTLPHGDGHQKVVHPRKPRTRVRLNLAFELVDPRLEHDVLLGESEHVGLDLVHVLLDPPKLSLLLDLLLPVLHQLLPVLLADILAPVKVGVQGLHRRGPRLVLELRGGPAHRAVERVHSRGEHDVVGAAGVGLGVRGLGDHRSRRRREGFGTLGRLELVGCAERRARARDSAPRGPQALAGATRRLVLAGGVLASLVQVEELFDDVLVDVAQRANEIRLELLILLDARVQSLLRGVHDCLKLRDRRGALRLLLRDLTELLAELQLDPHVVVGANLNLVGAHDEPRLHLRQPRVGVASPGGKLGELLVPRLDDVGSLLAGLAKLGVEEPAFLQEILLVNLVLLVILPREFLLLVAVILGLRLQHPVGFGEFLRLLSGLVVLELTTHHVLERAFGRIVGAASREPRRLGGILGIFLGPLFG